MKHIFKIGDGMSLENSTAEERKEIFKLISKHYPNTRQFELICSYLNQIKYRELYFDGNIWLLGTADRDKNKITNPLTYAQMKSLILGEKWNFIDAVNAVKSGSHQIEKDCDNLDLLRDVLKEAFPSNYTIMDIIILRGWNLFRRHCNIISELDSTHPEWNPDLKNLPIIKLSEIMPKEVNAASISIDSATKSIEKPELNIYQEIDKSIEILKACKNQIKKEAQDKMVDEIKQSVREVQEKPVELEIGHWYKKDQTLLLIECIDPKGHYFQRFHCYGFNSPTGYDRFCFDVYENTSHGYVLAETSEITESLKAEAIKRGLVEGVWISNIENDLVKNVQLKKGTALLFDAKTFNLGNQVVMKNGVWAQPIPTITRKEAEEKLNAKIVD